MPSSTVERLNHRRRSARTRTRDIIVIGGSAGAHEALRALLPALSPDIPAALFLVLHMAAKPESVLVDVLGRIAPLPVAEAEDGARFQPGRLYVAPPDFHLLLDGEHMAVRRGPRENLARPAIDILFRSAAVEFGPRVVGVLLSGMLSDGAAGLRAIKRCGGVAVVQDPADARHPDMPSHALDHVEIDHAVPARELAALIGRLAAEPAGEPQPAPADVRLEAQMAKNVDSSMAKEHRLGELSELTCPECGGVVWEIGDGPLLRYRCHTGHGFGADALLELQYDGVEHALWSALRAHEERLALLRRLAAQARKSNAALLAERWEETIAEHEAHAGAIRRVIVEAPRTRAPAERAVRSGGKRK